MIPCCSANTEKENEHIQKNLQTSTESDAIKQFINDTFQGIITLANIDKTRTDLLSN